MESVLGPVCIIEHDKNGDVLVTWSYPLTDKVIEQILIEKSPFRNPKYSNQDFLFSKYESNWIYYKTLFGPQNSKLNGFSIVVLAKEFDPEKYNALCTLFASIYNESDSPVKLLTAYLSLFGTGKYQKFNNAEFDPRKPKIGNLKELVTTFGEYSVIIWTAMLLKKRIVVYSEKVDDLLNIIRALPCLVWSRQQWDILRPLVNFSNESEMQDLKNAAIYVAGSIDENIKTDTKWFDLLVDISNQTVHIADHAREDLEVTKLHRDVARVMLNEELTNQKLIKELTLKTTDIIKRLYSLKKEGEKIKLSQLKELILPPSVERFLLNIAITENLMETTTTEE